jgi:geranylgeranyl reductase family protein
MKEVEVAIVGGGPAGAFCAFNLAKEDIFAMIFDDTHPREKPCGGGISLATLEKFPFLEQFRKYGGKSNKLKLISCTNKQNAVTDHKGFNVSRLLLDQHILRMATDHGAFHIKEKVLSIKKQDQCWRIKTDRQTLNAKFVIGADGVNSIVRKKTVGSIAREDLGLTYGYFGTGLEEAPTTIKFIAEVPGNIWIFPRNDHTVIGIGSEIKYGGEIKQILDQFLIEHFPNLNITSQYAAMLPWATNPDFFAQQCAGNDWLLVGDAAGHVDPLTGEGILYALWSGMLAAEAVSKYDLRRYDLLWQEQYGKLLQERCKRKDEFFNPLFVELSVANHMVQWNLGER